uniref:RNase III domain-containing protein n=1 Tax=Chromera velia CCMP2878 TaxID=1169474 RepID=A0A0G4H7A4_9ALVE|eukprot:Cvel_25022.t1-p1 / transcript=Cvel_25022.t1 / gene=Cvel_25022 / organism=Chromera_velia_CCMP2878 / gene_product=hypothetical protein / transcript_product=hypothetical protein / location=Cvel_scaffold2776:18423-20340(+) / protein_length=459 / sequence_SO=supercontig / SO=protein_coding / is_pseudo=false
MTKKRPASAGLDAVAVKAAEHLKLLKQLEELIGYEFERQLPFPLYRRLTKKEYSKLSSWGDKALEWAITDYLNTNFPDASPEILTALRERLAGRLTTTAVRRVWGLSQIIAHGPGKDPEEEILEYLFGLIFQDTGRQMVKTLPIVCQVFKKLFQPLLSLLGTIPLSPQTTRKMAPTACLHHGSGSQESEAPVALAGASSYLFRKGDGEMGRGGDGRYKKEDWEGERTEMVYKRKPSSEQARRLAGTQQPKKLTGILRENGKRRETGVDGHYQGLRDTIHKGQSNFKADGASEVGQSSEGAPRGAANVLLPLSFPHVCRNERGALYGKGATTKVQNLPGPGVMESTGRHAPMNGGGQNKSRGRSPAGISSRRTDRVEEMNRQARHKREKTADRDDRRSAETHSGVGTRLSSANQQGRRPDDNTTKGGERRQGGMDEKKEAEKTLSNRRGRGGKVWGNIFE